MYRIRYLPTALQNLEDITDYIIDFLKAPMATMDLLDALDNSISRLRQFPYSGKTYQPIQVIDTEYRMLLVKKYYVFYTVVNDDVEIHRIIYASMNLEKIMK